MKKLWKSIETDGLPDTNIANVSEDCLVAGPELDCVMAVYHGAEENFAAGWFESDGGGCRIKKTVSHYLIFELPDELEKI